jgi:hypothetical protein
MDTLPWSLFATIAPQLSPEHAAFLKFYKHYESRKSTKTSQPITLRNRSKMWKQIDQDQQRTISFTATDEENAQKMRENVTGAPNLESDVELWILGFWNQSSDILLCSFFFWRLVYRRKREICGEGELSEIVVPLWRWVGAARFRHSIRITFPLGFFFSQPGSDPSFVGSGKRNSFSFIEHEMKMH